MSVDVRELQQQLRCLMYVAVANLNAEGYRHAAFYEQHAEDSVDHLLKQANRGRAAY